MPSLYELASQAIAKIETVKTPRIFASSKPSKTLW
jgi:hypothetical protein